MHQAIEEYKVTTTYNGWTNRETWIVNLWLSSEECYYHELCSILKNFETVSEQSEELEGYVRFITDCDQGGLVGDMLGTSLGRVNWLEIVEGNLE